MKTEPIAHRCPKCQAPLPADAPQGLCAKCLLAAAATPTEAGQPPGQHWTPPPLETVKAAFPQLELVELIGQGGMGVVYKARQPKLDRFVALKILPQSLAADTAFAERFNREARVLARLNHPSIVTVHDFGQSGGFFYLLMEFVDGVNLRQAMQAGRFSPQQALFLVPKICEALQFAHDEGILHRDIKPENILLDTRARVKIADFGIAKLVGEAKENITLTASGLVVGTPHYMAPEQLEHPHDVDQRADIYSLGVVFYEMLTGELPIGRFAPPSQKSSVDPRVDAVVFHALEKEREKRFRSAGEVRTSVEAITANAPTPLAATPLESGPGGTVVLPPGAPRGPDAASAGAEQEYGSACYFSTAGRMRNCFPSAAARIFLCKGDLRLEAADLTFVSPWRTTITIPLKDIQDLSIGQFQMWTTPWVTKYARINFLAVTFRHEGSLQTVHLTPVPDGAASAGQINDCVGRWCEAIRQAVIARAGVAPRVSEPGAISISAEPAWGRKGWPLSLAFLAVWLPTCLFIPQAVARQQVPEWLLGLLVVVNAILLVAMLFWTRGFLQANRALNRANLDTVTSEEPPVAEPASGPAAGSTPPAHRPLWWTVSAWAFVAIGLLAVVDTLAGLYSRPMNPTFSPALAHLFAGIALLTLSRPWRRVALVALALALLAGAFITVMVAVSPGHGSLNLPGLDLSIPAAEKPRWVAAAAVFLALALGWPCYLLMCAKAKALFGIEPASGSGRSRPAAPSLPSFPRTAALWLVLLLLLLGGIGVLIFSGADRGLFGHRSASAAVSQLILDAVPPQYAPGSRDPRESGGRDWNFRCWVPADHLARVLFVRWSNSVPIVEPTLSAYFKTGHTGAGVDGFVSCDPQQPPASTVEERLMQLRTPDLAGTNQVLWSVNLGLGYTTGTMLPAQAPFLLLDTPSRLTVSSRQQAAIRLMVCAGPQGSPDPARGRVELRIQLEPLKSPAMRTAVSEKDLGNLVAGAGLDLPMEETLRLLDRLPSDL